MKSKQLAAVAVLASFVSTQFAMAAGPVTVAQAMNQYKASVYVAGTDRKQAADALVDQILENQFSIADLKGYVAAHASAKEYRQFNQIVDLASADLMSRGLVNSEEF